MLQDVTFSSASPSSSQFQTNTPAESGDEFNQASLVKERDHTARGAMQIYLSEIGQVPLLSEAEEIALAARIKKGDLVAREQMIAANLRLVVKIARDYEGYGLPLLDLINEGNIGLMKAVERFDPEKGAKLSTYGSWWIKQSIKRALANQTKTIRLPVHMVDKVLKMRRAESKLHEELGREPNADELANELGTTSEQVEMMRRVSAAPTSLDATISDDLEGAKYHEKFADLDHPSPFEELRTKENCAVLRAYLGDLDPREQLIIIQRFGLDGNPERTLEEVGKDLGITRERVRQIQEIALRKLADCIRHVNGEDPLYEHFTRRKSNSRELLLERD